METLTALLGLIAGFAIGSRFPKAKQQEAKEENDLPEWYKVQYSNFLNYDGTDRGQVDVKKQ